MPLAVLRPAWSITAIDATRKKVDFIRRTAAAIGLTNLRVEHAHSDHWECGDRYRIVTLRAVTRLGRSMESCARFVAPGGWLVAYKTAALDADERAAASATTSRLRLKAEPPHPYELRLGDEALRRALYAFYRPAGGS